jgi:predicted nucleotidyltransferase
LSKAEGEFLFPLFYAKFKGTLSEPAERRKQYMKAKNKKALTYNEIMRILKEHSDILKKYKVRKIGLFGSYVRGEQKKRSDIDFLVAFEEPTFDNFMELLFSLEKLLGKKVDLVTDGSLSPYIRPYVEKEIKWYED